MNIHIDERADGSYSLFIDGDLQFDTRDEALYHESLALPALCLVEHFLAVLGADGQHALWVDQHHGLLTVSSLDDSIVRRPDAGHIGSGDVLRKGPDT